MTDPMTPERLTEIEARLTTPRLGRSMAREADLDLLAIRGLLVEVRRLNEERVAFTSRLGFGDGITEPAATLADMTDPIEQAFTEAIEHEECPVICESCGEPLASQTCEKCHGSGCLPNAALAYLECDECAGVGKVHPGCAERSYAELAVEARRLQASVERVRALHGPHPYASDALRAVNPDVPASVCWECVSESGGAVAWPCPTITALDGDE